MKLANEFIKFVVKELQLPSLPRSIRFADANYAAEHLSFGTYNPLNDEIVISKENRHPVDVLRTLAHELVHHKQRLDGKTLDGNDGSDIENEANAVAGELMRKFRKIRPEIFKNMNSGGGKLKKIAAIAKTGTPQRIDEHYLDKFNARLILSTLRQLSPENKKRYIAESVPTMVHLAHKVFIR